MIDDIVMFVGHESYPTSDDYITESLSLGCSKRITRLPKNVIPGQSRCFLAHDDGKTGYGYIFGYFIIQGFEIILDDEEQIREYQEQHEQLNITGVRSEESRIEPRRLCGHRVYGAIYVVSRADAGPELDKAWDVAEALYSKADIGGGLVNLLHRIPYPRRRFRGWRYMEPVFLENFGWPQRTLPPHKIKRTVKVELKPRKGQNTLFEERPDEDENSETL